MQRTWGSFAAEATTRIQGLQANRETTPSAIPVDRERSGRAEGCRLCGGGA